VILLAELLAKGGAISSPKVLPRGLAMWGQLCASLRCWPCFTWGECAEPWCSSRQRPGQHCVPGKGGMSQANATRLVERCMTGTILSARRGRPPRRAEAHDVDSQSLTRCHQLFPSVPPLPAGHALGDGNMCGRYALALVSVRDQPVCITWLTACSGPRKCASGWSSPRCPSRTRPTTTRCDRATTSPRATTALSTEQTVLEMAASTKGERATPSTSCHRCNGVCSRSEHVAPQC
jgi:hypothetical protein